jgi:hypothetical protein
MLLCPAPKYRAWWDTKAAEQFSLKGLATILVAKRIAYLGYNRADNDSWTGN